MSLIKRLKLRLLSKTDQIQQINQEFKNYLQSFAKENIFIIPPLLDQENICSEQTFDEIFTEFEGLYYAVYQTETNKGNILFLEERKRFWIADELMNESEIEKETKKKKKKQTNIQRPSSYIKVNTMQYQNTITILPPEESKTMAATENSEINLNKVNQSANDNIANPNSNQEPNNNMDKIPDNSLDNKSNSPSNYNLNCIENNYSIDRNIIFEELALLKNQTSEFKKQIDFLNFDVKNLKEDNKDYKKLLNDLQIYFRLIPLRDFGKAILLYFRRFCHIQAFFGY